jgi:hypothetical protein
VSPEPTVEDFERAVFDAESLRMTMEDSGVWVGWLVGLALRERDECRYREARRLAGAWAEQGLRAARMLGLYRDDDAGGRA